MKILLLTLFITSTAFASHECKNYAFEKAARFAELIHCDPQVSECSADREKITILNFDEAQSDPSIDFYTLSVGVFASGRFFTSQEILVVVGLMGAGTTNCMTEKLELIYPFNS